MKAGFNFKDIENKDIFMLNELRSCYAVSGVGILSITNLTCLVFYAEKCADKS